MKRYVLTWALVAVLVIGVVAAVGSSTGREAPQTQDEPDTQEETQTTDTRTTQTTQTRQAVDCEQQASVASRVACRLSEPGEHTGVTPEGCRDIPSTARCQQLYDQSENCYAESAERKDTCFRDLVGFSSLPQASDQEIREYVVLLLYELQERIEDAHADRAVSTQDAGRAIAGIVAAKQSVQRGNSPAQVRSAVDSARSTYEEVMR